MSKLPLPADARERKFRLFIVGMNIVKYSVSLPGRFFQRLKRVKSSSRHVWDKLAQM
jgi:hypothetical protein